MIKTAQTNIAGPMDKAEAQAITDRIRGHISAAWKDLVRARDGQAWKALGYPTWEAYVKNEFGISDRHSRRLLDQGEVIAAIEDATGPMGPLSERATRELKDDLPANVEQIKARTDQGEAPAEAAKEVAIARRKEREQAKPEAAPIKQDAPAPAKPKPAPQPAEPLYNGLPAEDRINELLDEVKALESDNAALKAKLATFERLELMYRDWTEGGWEKVVQAKDDTIAEIQRTAQTRIARESGEKVSNLNAMRGLAKKLEAEGKGRDIYIDIETGEEVSG